MRCSLVYSVHHISWDTLLPKITLIIPERALPKVTLEDHLFATYRHTFSGLLTVHEFLLGEQAGSILVGGLDDLLHLFSRDVDPVAHVDPIDVIDREAPVTVLVGLAEGLNERLSLMAITDLLLIEKHNCGHAVAAMHTEILQSQSPPPPQVYTALVSRMGKNTDGRERSGRNLALVTNRLCFFTALPQGA